MTDDLKKPTPQSSFKPVGTYRGAEPKATAAVELPPAWAIALGEKIEGVSKSQSNMSNAVSEFGLKLNRFDTALELVRGEVHELRTWKKSVGDSGMMQPFVRTEGPQATTSGEVRRISASEIVQNKAITGLSENQVALSDKVDVIASKLESSEKKVDELVKSQSEQTEKLVSIGTAVTGFAKEHPTLTNGIVSLVTAGIVWLTAWLNSRGH